jgi:hypothetical protein
MKVELAQVRIGLAMVLLCLVFGIGMGVAFGIGEDLFKQHVAAGIAAHPQLHDSVSAPAIVRWALRAHFHATGISAFALGLIAMIAFSDMRPAMKQRTAALVGLGGLYPLAWFTMYWVAPGIGRKAAHEHWLVQVLTCVGVGGLALGILLLVVGVLFPSRRTATVA